MINNTDKQYFGRAGVNYFQTPGFENGNGDWSEFTTTYVNNIPTTITSGAANIATPASVFGVGGLRGKMGYYAIFNAATAGEGLISNVLTIDTVDRAKVLTVSFEYLISPGGNFNASGTSTQSVEVWIYDVTNAAWIQPAGYRGMNQTNSGSNNLCGFFQCTFQTPSNGGQFRVAIIVKNTVTCTISFDTFSFGPQSTVQGAAISDWVSSTPTYSNAGTTSLSVHSTRRVGDTLQIQGRSVFATAGAAAVLRLRIPSSIGTIDTTKVQTGNLAGTVGSYFAQIGGSIFNGNVTLTTTANEVSFIPDGAGGSHLGSAFGLNTELTYTLSVPISGWSSNTVLSQDTDTRVVAARATSAITGVVAGDATVIYPTLVNDTHGSYSAATGIYTVSVSGFYRATASIFFDVYSWTAGDLVDLRINCAGTIVSRNYYRMPTLTSKQISADTCSTFYATAGQQITVSASQNVGGTRNLDGNSSLNYFTVERLSGPATIAASETVAMSATKITGNHTSNGGDQIVAAWSGVITDSHGAFNATTGVYTVPVSGRYLITGQVNFNAGTGSQWAFIVAGGGTLGGGINQTGFRVCLPVAGELKLNAGDTISLFAFQNSSAAFAYSADSRFGTLLNVVRVGN